MKKTTKILSVCLMLVIVASCAFVFVACNKDDGTVKNLIYVIGDGMGFAHVNNARVHMEKSNLCFEPYYAAQVTTHSANNAITDSAAAATALATGTKTNNGYIGIDPDGKNLQNIMELSKSLGKKTGVVTTDALDGATPAGFSSHAGSRNFGFDIMLGQTSGDVDLFVGKNSSSYSIYEEYFTEVGYKYTEDFASLTKMSKRKQIVGNVENFASPYDPNSQNATSLKKAVEYALEYLSKNNRNGFTLMVEGAYIDKYSHNNDVMSMIYAMMDLNDVMQYVLDWASERTDTAVIFTADHETGGLKMATDKSQLSNALYTDDDHTAANVPLYLYNLKPAGGVIDNVDVYAIAKSAVLGEVKVD